MFTKSELEEVERDFANKCPQEEFEKLCILLESLHWKDVLQSGLQLILHSFEIEEHLIEKFFHLFNKKTINEVIKTQKLSKTFLITHCGKFNPSLLKKNKKIFLIKEEIDILKTIHKMTK